MPGLMTDDLFIPKRNANKLLCAEVGRLEVEATSLEKERRRLEAELASRPAVLPYDVRKFLEKLPKCAQCYVGGFVAEVEWLLAKYASGVPQDVATQPQGEPVASKLDSDHSQARALHRVVRAMHDGECPKCHALHDSRVMTQQHTFPSDHRCPSCGFTITRDEVAAALAEFGKFMEQNLAVFETWRASRSNEPIQPPKPYRAGDLPGYKYHDEHLSVFAANGRTAIVRVNIDGEWWVTETPNRDLPIDCADREAAERAASRFVMGETT